MGIIRIINNTYFFLLILIASQYVVRGEADISITAEVNETEYNQIYSYANTNGFNAQENGDSNNNLVSIDLTLPSPFDANGDELLPTTPIQTIYRFQYVTISKLKNAASPFIYVEVDWNTEGLPRGPNNSFLKPHYDFHFYLQERAFLQQNVFCPQLVGPSIGRVCDPFQTPYEQYAKFLAVPPQSLMPPNYFTDSGSPITEMGLHNLDALMNYTIQNVDETPVILYGSFDSKVLFLEFSITLPAFQSVQNGGVYSAPIRPPNGVSSSQYWPQRFQLTYDSNSNLFTASLTDITYLKASDGVHLVQSYGVFVLILFVYLGL